MKGQGWEQHCASQPRNFHARKKTTARPNTHAIHQHQPSEATQSIPPSSSRQPPATTTPSDSRSLVDLDDFKSLAMHSPPQPRNYHARKKTTARTDTYAIHQPSEATQSITLPSSQQPPATITISDALPAVATTALATGTSSHLDITIKRAGRWTRFLLWIGCVSIQYTDNQH